MVTGTAADPSNLEHKSRTLREDEDEMPDGWTDRLDGLEASLNDTFGRRECDRHRGIKTADSLRTPPAASRTSRHLTWPTYSNSDREMDGARKFPNRKSVQGRVVSIDSR